MTATRIFLLVSLLIALPAASLRAGEARQAELDILRDTIRANKRALIAVNLPLTDEEAGKFWPIYDRYEGELRTINDRVVKLLDEYTTSFPNLSNDRAAALIGDYLAAEADRAQLRRTYLPDISKALPGRKVARFYQIENKMDAIVRYDLAAHIPVVEP
jgi:hypothetical protein